MAAIWESIYFHETRQLFGYETLQVRSWYSHYGLEIDNKGAVPDDHLGLEFVFIAHLARLIFEALDASEAERYKGLKHAKKQFIQEHPLRWAELWKNEVLQHARTDFFKGISLLVVGSLKETNERSAP